MLTFSCFCFTLNNFNYGAIIRTADIYGTLWRGRERLYDFTTKVSDLHCPKDLLSAV